MQELLKRKLHAYIRDNNPDLLLILEQERRVSDYLQECVNSIDQFQEQLMAEGKAPLLIGERCMSELTRPLRPSRFNYLKELLEDEFPKVFEKLDAAGVLQTELINMISACDEVFDELNFSEDNENDRNIRYAVIGVLYEYLNKS